MKRVLSLVLTMILVCAALPLGALADDTFTDERFQGIYTTENLDAIMDEYDLIDGWFWVTKANVKQDYHGHDIKGWTDSTEQSGRTGWGNGWYGCRWGWNAIDAAYPNGLGWGEAFGFAQFIGYLLSGSRNAHGEWYQYESIRSAGGLKPGDILRMYYEEDGQRFEHSAVVYSVEGDKVKFLQVSGSYFNMLRLEQGYRAKGLNGMNSLAELKLQRGLTVLRSRDNLYEQTGPYPTVRPLATAEPDGTDGVVPVDLDEFDEEMWHGQLDGEIIVLPSPTPAAE